MKLPIAVRAPFSLAQSVTFMRRFAPCRQGLLIDDDDRVTAALAIGGRAVPFTIAPAARGGVEVECDDGLAPVTAALVAERARQWLGADDDLTSFYAAAEGDHPRFRALVTALHGLHHVRFLTLAEIAVYAVLMQRTPIVQAARAKDRFTARFGPAVVVRGVTLRAFPTFDELVALEAEDYREVVRLPGKAAALPGVVRGVAELGEAFLRGAPYAEAHAALMKVKGIGPFSAAAILLRGLGRMDDVPLEGEQFTRPAREVYGDAFDPAAIRRRYGRDVGYWSFYVKTGAARVTEARADRSSPSAHR